LPVTFKAGSKVYHSHECRAAKRIKQSKSSERRDAESMGLTPCRNCEHRK